MPGLRSRKKEQTHKAIIEAAIRLFADQGFEQTSMNDLARAAGIGKSTIYGYFQTKEEIFLAYCEAEIDFAFAALDRKLDEAAPLPDQLVAQLMAQISFVTANREFGRLFVRDMLFPADTTRLTSRDLDRRYLVKIGEVLGAAQSRGELPAECDLLLLIGHLHALYIMVLSSFYRRDIAVLEDAEVFLRALVLQALGGPTSPPPPGAAGVRWSSLKEQFLQQRELDL